MTTQLLPNINGQCVDSKLENDGESPTANNTTRSDTQHQNIAPEENSNPTSQLTVNSRGPVNVMVQIGNDNNINYDPSQQILNAGNLSYGPDSP